MKFLSVMSIAIQTMGIINIDLTKYIFFIAEKVHSNLHYNCYSPKPFLQNPRALRKQRFYTADICLPYFFYNKRVGDLPTLQKSKYYAQAATAASAAEAASAV